MWGPFSRNDVSHKVTATCVVVAIVVVVVVAAEIFKCTSITIVLFVEMMRQGYDEPPPSHLLTLFNGMQQCA